MTTATESIVTDNRDATHDDAVNLLNSYRALAKARSEVKKATNAIDDGWIDGDVLGLRVKRSTAIFAYDAALDLAWDALKAIPKGTVAPGGMTVQTVGLEFFNKALNRDGKRRLTASAARKINSLSASL